MEKDKGAAELRRNVRRREGVSRAEAHYEAGLQAIDALKAPRQSRQDSQRPKDQQAPVQKRSTLPRHGCDRTVCGTAIDEADPTRCTVRLGEAYESMNKWQDAADIRLQRNGLLVRVGCILHYSCSRKPHPNGTVRSRGWVIRLHHCCAQTVRSQPCRRQR